MKWFHSPRTLAHDLARFAIEFLMAMHGVAISQRPEDGVPRYFHPEDYNEQRWRWTTEVVADEAPKQVLPTW
jgi:hypothetical protein